MSNELTLWIVALVEAYLLWLKLKKNYGRWPWSSGYGRRLMSKVVGSNLSTVYWMDIFSHLFVVGIVMFVWKDENKWKEAEDGPFKKIKN